VRVALFLVPLLVVLLSSTSPLTRDVTSDAWGWIWFGGDAEDATDLAVRAGEGLARLSCGRWVSGWY
jgi:hypothetical protein